MGKIIVLGLCLSLSSCSNPFGKNTLIEGITSGINVLFGGKTSSEFLAGGGQQYQTAAQYNVSVSVGNYLSQSATVTNGGYSVMATIKSD